MRAFMIGVLVLVLSVFPVVGSGAPKKARTPMEFYGANQVEMIVPYSAGGPVDFGARLFASYWPNYVKGGSMVVANTKGGGGIASHNFVMKGPKDGLTICGTSLPGAVGYPLYKAAGVRWKIKDIQWIGMVYKDVLVFSLSPKSPYKSLEELKQAKGLKFGGLSPGGNISLGPAFISAVMGLDATVILGYRGTTDIALAVAKGELDGYVEDAAGVIKRVQQGLVKPPLVVLSNKRSPHFPDTPALPEVVKLTPEQQTWLSFFRYVPQGNPIFVRDGVPQDRVTFLRDAFDKIVAIPPYKRQMETYFGSWSEPISGKELTADVAELASIPEAAVDAFIAATDKYMYGKK
jgi:tripartite-type tricarboxylate transporter receptor subunit TctC